MANTKLKTEMAGTTSRWTRRADAKQSSRKRRRQADRAHSIFRLDESLLDSDGTQRPLEGQKE